MAALFAYVVYAAATRPVTLGEAILWDDLVRRPLRDAWTAPDAWSGLLYAVLAKRAAGLFRLSEFSLRLPAVLSCAVCLLALRRSRLVAFVTVAVALGWFSTAQGHGLALAFCALAISKPRYAGIFGGLAIAASPDFALPLAVIATVYVLRGGIPALEQIVIPAVTTAFILLIVPLSHAAMPGSRPAIGGREEAALRSKLRGLRDRGPLRIGAGPAALPIVEFYKARYRQRAWEISLDPSRPGVVVFSHSKVPPN